ncbi:MAG TPA: SDR family NAD(P)-dependent oxidoreductase [Polyangiaceae bacterium]|nr:SDR family NAD(P)-dependent oxidoreductase [Polyangiaceae bacterium]
MERKRIEWDGRVALVTGASSGIGLAVTQALVRRGARVAMVARSRERLDEAVHDLGSDRVAAFPLDVCDRVALVKLPERVVDRFGRLDCVVQSAGVNHRGAVAERTIEELGGILDANLVAPVLLTRVALPFLKPGGAIVNIASLAGKVPIRDEATYSASKAGLRAFGRALGEELRGSGLTVTTVCPGPVDTGFLGDARDVPPIVFSQPMSSAASVADAVLASIESARGEVDIPHLSGKLATLGYLAPALFSALRPVLERRGARNKARFMSGEPGRRRTS